MTGSKDIPDPEIYTRLEQEASAGVGKKIGPFWLPHLMGSGTPEGDIYSRGALIGLQIEHTGSDLFRALIESLAFWLRQNLEVVNSLTGQAVERLVLVGGATRLQLLDQLKADVLDMPIRVSQIPEASAVGAALLAGLGTGIFHSADEAVSSLAYPERTLVPDKARARWYRDLYGQYYQALYPTLKEIHHRFNRDR